MPYIGGVIPSIRPTALPSTIQSNSIADHTQSPVAGESDRFFLSYKSRALSALSSQHSNTTSWTTPAPLSSETENLRRVPDNADNRNAEYFDDKQLQHTATAAQYKVLRDRPS